MKLNLRITYPVFFSLVLLLISCGGGDKKEASSPGLMPAEHGSMSDQHQDETKTDDMHQQHNSLANNFSHKDIVILDQTYQPAEITRKELEQVIKAYLGVKDALVKEDEDAVNNATRMMTDKVEAVIPINLEGRGLEAWQNHKTLYETKLKEMQHIKGLENKRSYFSHLSEILYCTIKSFGLKKGSLFAIYCPMALNNTGAFWISDSEAIQNPYLSAKMPTCGEIKENL